MSRARIEAVMTLWWEVLRSAIDDAINVDAARIDQYRARRWIFSKDTGFQSFHYISGLYGFDPIRLRRWVDQSIERREAGGDDRPDPIREALRVELR